MVDEVKYNDYPLLEVAAEAARKVDEGGTAYQKWSCGHCGSRQTMEVPNVFYMSGRCEECNQVTVITACNYLLHMGATL